MCQVVSSANLLKLSILFRQLAHYLLYLLLLVYLCFLFFDLNFLFEIFYKQLNLILNIFSHTGSRNFRILMISLCFSLLGWCRWDIWKFSCIHPTLGGVAPSSRGARGQKTPEMNVSRAVDNRSAQVFCLTPTELRE